MNKSRKTIDRYDMNGGYSISHQGSWMLYDEHIAKVDELEDHVRAITQENNQLHQYNGTLARKTIKAVETASSSKILFMGAMGMFPNLLMQLAEFGDSLPKGQQDKLLVVIGEVSEGIAKLSLAAELVGKREDKDD